MNKKVMIGVGAVVLAVIIAVTAILAVSCNDNPGPNPGPNPGSKTDALVVMSEELNGLFSPFYATSGSDMEVVGMTQISMMTTKYDPTKDTAVLAWGDEEAVVVKDYESKYNANNDTTTFTYVLKNGIKFSDGHPITMEDVLFNMYVYLDPAYAGSTTMYSTDIVGLQEYRLQRASSNDEEESLLNTQASGRAFNRINELITLWKNTDETPSDGSYEVDEATMRDAIAAKSKFADGYKKAIAKTADWAEVDWNAQLLADYNETLRLFKEELGNDYKAAKDSYTEEPYKSWEQFKDPVFCFMYTEGFVEVEWAKKIGANGRQTDDKSKIEKLTPLYSTTVVKDQASAINYVYQTKVSQNLDQILSYWGTASTLRTEYTAKAKDVILHESLTGDELPYPRVEGIVSVGHNTEETSIRVNGTDYAVARNYNNDGTVANANEYAVLQITINGVDPKAKWNFSFTVAPQHYYAENRTVDIAHNNFGVAWADFDFHKSEIQSVRNVKVPMGGGPYVATSSSNKDNPEGNEFYSNNVVYYKANPNFVLGEPNIKKLRYQVVSSNNALSQLESGAVHFVTPQFTKENQQQIESQKGNGIRSKATWQLGYGYVGINAGKVPNIYLRRAIMAAMNIELALNYYSTGTAKAIHWPMSTVSWAYPKNADGTPNTNNGHDYTQYPKVGDAAANKAAAIAKVQELMSIAGVSAGSGDLKMKFTIAGSNLTEHPTYTVFKNAADILNECGWDVEVVPDTQALTKLSTGALTVWAAAWGSTIDPDMYQVYHKDSTATSVKAWGY
ncbi:MAG: hypothetical protein IJF71_03315, partial [Clostridia bacterium]|nr:hypothetical protein [Clostridia bacterium]